MRTLCDRIVFQEVPNEVSILFQVTGCQVHCKGCHSQDLWNKKNGTNLSNDYFEERILKYKGLVTCVLFFGGEWFEDELIEKFKIAKSYGLKTCLYSGENIVSKDILKELDFVKFGPWMNERGGLNSTTTNQVFLDAKTGESLNHLFKPTQYIHTQEKYHTEVLNA